MTVNRVSSVRGTNSTRARPFSTNNPFRNASYDSNIGSRTASQSSEQQHFNNWVARNQSQMSFSSDDEDGDLFKAPQRPIPHRTQSNSSAGSANSRGIPT